MMQKRVLAVYFSIMRRRAICAVEVMASASSRMISLKWAREAWEEEVGAAVKICFVPGAFVSIGLGNGSCHEGCAYLQRS